MPFAPIDGKGTVLEYEDSGIPQSTDYTTVFLVNAYLWHGGVFRRMFPLAPKHNLRLIAIHQREYCGSSPFSEEELALLHSDDPEDQAVILREQAHAIAKVMAHVIKQENLPLPHQRNGVKTGGVVLLSRSAGCAHALALLGNLDSLDEHVSSLLQEYVTTVIIHDGPSVVFGIPEPAGTQHPLKDVTLSPEKVIQTFVSWTTAWHEPFPNLQSVTPQSIIRRKNLSESSSDPKYKPTRMNEQDMQELANIEVAERMGPLFVHWTVAKEYTRRALLDTGGLWKDVNVVLEWADMSFWTAAWAARVLHDMLAEPARDGEQRRSVRFLQLTNTNCWVHLEEPDRMLRLIVQQTR